MADSVLDGSPVIELNEEIEGDDVGSRNYRFAKIGEPVPIKSGDASEFDPGCLPSRPLVVSERFRLLFIVHPQGFYVTRTKDIMASAEKIKEKQEGPSVQESSLVDISVGKISVLALSADDSVIAACVATHVHFFAVSALLHKEKKPSYSVSLDESIHFKDFCWARKVSKDYIVLAACGKLYYGSGQGPLSCVMEDVDAVDWSVKGNFVVVARKNRVSILSSQFKEKLSFMLQFQSVTGDSDVNQVIKVDSIQWIRSDCIAVGCFQINEDGDEENYTIQVITNEGRKITDVSGSKPTVLSFNNVFMDFSMDAVPAKNGPHLFLSYLDHWGVAFVANRNLSQHVGLFRWSLDKGTNEIAMVEILNDAWNLYIDSQDNGEENVIVGLCVDKVSQNEGTTFLLGDEEAEVSPCCVIICLTIDGKISVFHFACAAGALVPPKGCISDEEVADCETSTKPEVDLISSANDMNTREPTVAVTNSSGLGRTETVKIGAEPSTTKNLPYSFNVDARSQEQTKSESTGQRPIIHPQTAKVIEPKKIFPLNHDNKVDGGSVSEIKNGIGSFTGKAGGDISHQSMSKHPMSGSSMEPLGKVPPTGSESLWSLSKLNPRNDASKTFDESFTKHPYYTVDNSNKPTLQSAEGVPRHPTDLKEKGKPSVSCSSFGQTLATGQVSRSSVPGYSVSQVPVGESVASRKYSQPEYKKGLKVASSSAVLPSFAQNTSKQFGNVEEMAKKLDSLLEGIEGKGGFRDASITSQGQCLTALEEDIWALSNRCSIWRGLMDKQLREVLLLFDNMIKVSVRKVYMEGIFKQAKDSRYWELWNRQKLSSELELKRRCILKLNQELTNKLIELERHFNSLEFNKFGENGGMQNNRRVLLNCQGPSRKLQSLHSLHNTIQSQLAAAEQLSGRLSEQMAGLSIESSGKPDLKKQLFECIGLSYDETPRSLTRDRTFGTPSKTVPSITTGTFTEKEQSKRSLATFAKSEEPETARRRRESLDHSWASFDPPTMTVKRTVKEDYEKGSANQSFADIDKPNLRSWMQNKSEVVHSAHLNLSGASVSHMKTKGPTEIRAEQFAKNSMSVFQKTAGLVDHGLLVSTSRPAPPTFVTSITENTELGGSIKLVDERSQSSLSFTGKTDSLAASTSKFVLKSDTSFNSLPSVSKWLPEHLSKPPSGSTENVNHSKIGFSMSTTWDEKNGLVASGTPSFGTKSPTIPTSTFSSGLNVAEKGLFTKSVDKPSKSNDGPLASTPLQSVVGPSLLSNSTFSSVSSFVSKPSSSTVYPLTPSSGANVATGVETSEPLASVPSTLNFATALPSSTHASGLSSVSHSSGEIKSEPLTSFSHPPLVMTDKKTSNASHAQTSVVNVTSKTIKEDETQASATKPSMLVSVFDLKLGLSTSSRPAEVSSDVSSSTKISSMVTLDTKLELPQVTEGVSPIAPSTEAIVGNLKNVIADVSNEEEMEEEAPETQQTTELAIGNLGGFGLGTTPNSTLPKSNPFGVGILKQDSPIANSPLMMPSSSSELFRPASFNFQSPQSQEPQPAVGFSGGFGSGNHGQVSGGSGFGQPAHIGAGQQALGSVLGTFGQSRQFGAGPTGINAASASGFGSGFSGISGGAFGGGFASATGGGFAGLAAGAGGFAAAATAGAGGFAAAATSGGGFAAVASVGGGFAAAANPGGGFAGAGSGFAPASSAAGAISGGGFGGFGNQQQGIGGVPQSQLFTQMRK